jgi:hypothetical protein
MTIKVLTLEFVRSSVRALQNERIHPHFPAYLQLRRLVALGADPAAIPFVPAEMYSMLAVPGGPPDRPHFRPFSNENVKDPSKWWLNKNLAGSYARGSIRKTATFLVDDSGTYVLAPGHVQTARNVFLLQKKVPAWAIAGYFMRNHGFDTTEDYAGDERTLLFDGFMNHFGLARENDFETLFDSSASPDPTVEPWFQDVEQVAPADEETIDA